MKKTSKKIIAPVVVTFVLIIAAVSTTTISAHRGAGSEDMAQRIANRFGVEKEDVEAVFDEAKADHFAKMQAKLEERLQKLVDEGKLTEEQKNEWLEMHEEHIANMDSYSELSPKERAEMKKEHHEGMKIWMDENGVNPSEIMPFMGKMHSKGHKGYMFGKHFAK